jgi:hypothetical protein
VREAEEFPLLEAVTRERMLKRADCRTLSGGFGDL